MSCFWLWTPAFCLSDERDYFFGLWGGRLVGSALVIVEFWYSWIFLFFLLFGYRHWQRSFAFVTRETTAAKSSYLYDKHINSCLGPYWLLTCETFLRVPHAAVQTSVPASDPPPLAPPRSIRFAGPDAFYCHVNVRWVMTDFILFYFMLFQTVLIYSVVVNIESWGWVRWWEGLLVLRAGLLAGLTAL